MITAVENYLSRRPWTRWLAPWWLAEVASRLACALLGAAGVQRCHAAERRLRGLLLAPHLRATRLRIDRDVRLEHAASVRLGHGVTLYGRSTYLTGIDGWISIGDGSHIGHGALVSGLGGVTIGRGCAIGGGLIVYSQSNQHNSGDSTTILDNPICYAPVVIGDNVWIGAGVTLLPGVTIGDNAVVGAGSLVNRDVPPWHVAVGVPATAVKDRRRSAA